MSQRSRNWCGTYNNPPEDADPENDMEVEFGVYQHEHGGPPNNTHHLQMYVVLKNAKTLSAMRKLYPGIHWEIRIGSHAQAKAYCEDPEKRDPDTEPVVWGVEPQKQGKRNDLTAIQAMLDSGESMQAVSREYFGQFVRYGRGFGNYQTLNATQRTSHTFTNVFYGPPGTGKSNLALIEAGPSAFWLPRPAGQSLWFDGYHGQEDVVIDDFSGWISRTMMQRMCDTYPLRVETKGGTVSFMAKRIWITSNQHPRDWWPNVGIGPMERRLKEPLGKIFPEMTDVFEHEGVVARAHDSDLDDDDIDEDVEGEKGARFVRHSELEDVLANLD